MIGEPTSSPREFHWRGDIYFRVTSNGDVEVFKRPKRVAYWTHDKGFHDPETPFFTVDAASWRSIIAFTAAASTPQPAPPASEPQEARGEEELALRIERAIERETRNLPMKASDVTISVLIDCLAALRQSPPASSVVGTEQIAALAEEIVKEWFDHHDPGSIGRCSSYVREELHNRLLDRAREGE